ncbi:alpha/beta fold hydrolase [Streptomyces nigrescens]|uniref:alpha/beta fold hydrolase n=1 Tax=Streptomyces nigrescens TaxID=1920 RepID=UPI00225ADE2B|nr:alpha/beta fold hydrolase [Streptomyces libani]
MSRFCWPRGWAPTGCGFRTGCAGCWPRRASPWPGTTSATAASRPTCRPPPPATPSPHSSPSVKRHTRRRTWQMMPSPSWTRWGWRSAHLLGVSLGGAVAQRVALRHPGRVRSLTSMAAVPGDTSGLRAMRYIRMRTLAKFARLRFPDTREGAVAAGIAVSRLLASPRRPFDEPAAREAAERNADRGIHDQQAQSRQIGAQWHGPPISAITRPTLVLHGEDDPLIKPSAGKAIASRIHDSRLVLLPRVGHEIPECAWDTVATEIRTLATNSRQLPPAPGN